MTAARNKPERMRAIYAVGIGPDCEKLRQEQCPGEPLYDTAVCVVDTAHSEGLAHHEIERNPAQAVRLVRKLWASLPTAVPSEVS